MEKISLGFVDYANCLPINYYFSKEKNSTYDLICKKPAVLNDLMQHGQLNVSNISSIEYARNQNKYLLIPGVCISSAEKARSVVLYSRKNISELDGATIALTSASATSQVLLKILLKKRYGFPNNFLECPPDLDVMLEKAEGALLIGDDALRANERRDLNRYDLGELWKEFTGLSFVFSVWVINKDWAQHHAGYIPEILLDFNSALEKSGQYIAEVIEDYARSELNVDLQTYFNDINFDFNSDAEKGLLLFYQFAAELGFAPECLGLEYLTLPE